MAFAAHAPNFMKESSSRFPKTPKVGGSVTRFPGKPYRNRTWTKPSGPVPNLPKLPPKTGPLGGLGKLRGFGRGLGKALPLAGLAADSGLFGIAESIVDGGLGADPGPTGARKGPLINGGFYRGFEFNTGTGQVDYHGITYLDTDLNWNGPNAIGIHFHDFWTRPITGPSQVHLLGLYPYPPTIGSFSVAYYFLDVVWRNWGAGNFPNYWYDPYLNPVSDPVPQVRPRVKPRGQPRPRPRIRPRITSLEVVTTPTKVHLNINPTPRPPRFRYRERKGENTKAVAAVAGALETIGDAIEIGNVFADAYDLDQQRMEWERAFDGFVAFMEDLVDNGVPDRLDVGTLVEGLGKHALWEKIGSKIGDLQRGAGESSGQLYDIFAGNLSRFQNIAKG